MARKPRYPITVEKPCGYCGIIRKYTVNSRLEERRLVFCDDSCKKARAKAIKEGRMQPRRSSPTAGGGSKKGDYTSMEVPPRKDIEDIPGPTPYELSLYK